MKKDWEIKKLGEVCYFENGDRGKNYPNKSYRVSSGVPFINAGHLNNNCIDFSEMDYISEERFELLGNGKIKPNDILFCLRGSLGKVAIVGNLDKGAIASSLVILRIKNEINNAFLLHFLNSDLTRKQIFEFGNGAAQPNLSAGSLKKFEIPLPPLPEQQRIVALLDEAFAAIAKAKANAEQNLKNAKELFESYLQGVFEKGNWEEKVLGDLCERVSVGHVGETSKYYCDKSNGIPFLRSQNVRSGYLDFQGIQHITNEFHDTLKKSQLTKGDILFVRVGANRGDCCVVREDYGKLNCANIVFARLKSGNDEFIERYCQSRDGKKQLLGMSVGAAQGVINTRSVAELKIPYPSLKEQQKIVSQLDYLKLETQKLEDLYRKKIEDLEELKKSILQKAFAGEL